MDPSRFVPSQFQNPLDIIEHPETGNLYVADLMAKKIVLCRPVK